MVEPSKEPILLRCAKLSQSFLTSNFANKQNAVTLEGLLDAFLLLYDECNNDFIKDSDKHVAEFVNKYRNSVAGLKSLRVNIGDFEVHKIIGRGHFGEVQVVREKKTGEVHAMKILRKNDTLAKENTAFFEEERDIMAKAQNPWITQLHYAFQDHHNLYLVMEFHPGGDLLSLMDRCDDIFPESTAQFYMAEMTLAIHTLHQMGFVHRDIKPDNILIDRTGHIKLADFGSSARLTSNGKVQTKMPVGTPDYLAPEVLSGMNGEKASTFYGIECDWWSLGVVSYEMLCGNTPFTDEKATITFYNIMNHKNTFSWPCEMTFSPDTKDVIYGLLEEASDRFGFHELRKHAFFSNINWNDIRNTVPPFVPKVTSQDDTSNFDKFEKELHIPNVEDYKTKRTFSGKNLPFVGFTFTHNLSLNFDPKKERRISFDPNSRISKLEAQLESKKHEVQELNVRVSNLQESNDKSKSNIEQLQSQLNLKEEAFNSVKLERDINEKDLANCVKEITKLKRFLEFERNERLLNEKKAMQLISEAQNKWKREEDNLKSRLEKREVDFANNEPKYVEMKANEAKYKKLLEGITKELSEAKKQMSEYKQKLNRIMGNKKESLGEVNVMLEKIAQENEAELNKFRKLLDEAKKRKNELKEKLLKTESKLRQKDHRIKELEKENEVLNLVKKNEMKLKEELKEMETKYFSLESKMSDLVGSSDDFSAREYAFQELQKSVAEEAVQTRIMQEKISFLEGELNNAVTQQFQSLSNVHKEISAEIQFLQDLTLEKKEAENIKMKLESELEIVEEKRREQSKQILDLEAIIVRLEENLKSVEMASLEKKESHGNSEELNVNEEKVSLEAQVAKLETQLARSREVSSSERQRVREVQEEMRKIQKEHSDVKLDLRLSQREAKKSQEEITSLQTTQKTLQTNLESAKSQIEELKQKEEQFMAKNKSLETELTVKETQMQSQKENFDREKSKLNERLSELEKIKQENFSKQYEKEKISCQNEELIKQKSMLEEQIRLLTQLNEQKQNEEKSLREELEEKMKKCKSLEKTDNVLKSTCLMLEGQLKDYEILVENHEVEQEKLNNDKETLINEVKILEEEVEKTKKILAEESNEKLNLLEEVKNLQNKLNVVKAEQKAQANTLKGELHEQKEAVIQYNDELNDVEQKLITAERARRNYQQRAETLEHESVKIKEEAAKLITQVNSLKESNFQLTIGLEEAIDKCEFAKSQIVQLENMLETTEAAHNVEKVKMEATIAQQIKLINFLQEKNEGMHKKKKTFQEKLFGRNTKTNVQGMETPNRNLQRVPSLKSPTPKSRGILSAITQSPGVQNDLENTTESSDVVPNPTMERMHHKIPHRFQTALNLRATKCATCLDTIHFGRSSAKCQECHLTVHPKCANLLPSTCGLPTGLIQHFRQSIRKKLPIKKMDSFNNDQNMEGWIKVLRKRKSIWEGLFARVEDGKLFLYEKENMNSESPIESVVLCPPNAETIVHSAVSPAELINTAKSDLAYILKLEIIPQTTCWPERILYLMAPNFSEKQKWVAVLESIAKDHAIKRKKVKDAKLFGTNLLHLEGENMLDVNCAVNLQSKVILIGAEEGLFCLEVDGDKPIKKLKKLDGIDSVFQLEIIKYLGYVIIIKGNDRELCQLTLSSLEDSIESKGTVKFECKTIENITSSHLFATKKTMGTSYICVATADKIILCRYDFNLSSFCIVKELSTNEPCSCVHFLNNSVVVGTDRYFEIDLKKLLVEEFLDASDKSLAHARYAINQLNSFPIAILEICEESHEFLLCFHEFGIFVDSNGRRTRKNDIKWTRLPFAFAYQAPYLFITHFNCIEITEIGLTSEKSKGRRTFLYTHNPRYLGQRSDGGVYFASANESNLDVICIQGNLVEMEESESVDGGDVDESEDGVTSDSEFSFSSSVMNILEPDTTTDCSSVYSHIN